MGILQARMLEWVAMSPSGDIPNPGIKPRSPTLYADSSPFEPPGKPKNTGMGSLSFLQGVFSTQELNRGHLHCRQIPYQLINQGSPSEVERKLIIILIILQMGKQEWGSSHFPKVSQWVRVELGFEHNDVHYVIFNNSVFLIPSPKNKKPNQLRRHIITHLAGHQFKS